MGFFRPARSLPLGVDIRTDAISVVAPSAPRNQFVIRATRTREIPPCASDRRERTIVDTLREIIDDLGGKERRCILAAPSADTITRTFRVPPGMRYREAERAAALEADMLVDWPRSERLIALDSLPDCEDRMLLSIARTNAIESLVAIARAAGLRPIAVDVAACAWRRAIANADAILDCTSERAELVIFSAAVGTVHTFAPRLVDERLAAHVRGAFVDARRDGLSDVQRLVILGSRFRYEALEEVLRDDGYSIGTVYVAGFEAPAWTFAYGLASWSVPTSHLAAS